MQNETLTFIGPGVMAEAIIAGLLRQGISTPEKILACGPRPERGEELRSRYGINFRLDSASGVREARVIILAVKPQKLSAVMKTLAGEASPEALILSIVAGASMRKISAGLKHNAIVRSMPNTPGQIGQGITVWTASEAVGPEQRESARAILGALGQEVFVEDEHYLDMATALSGSGPAYVFLFMEALIDAGVHLGFPRRIAEQLVLQTLRGSAAFYEQAARHPATLRNQVTSPGGTSAEALYYLEKAGFRTAISRAIWAAYQRSLELGKEKPGHVDDLA